MSISCAICGKEFNKLMQHVRTIHHLTIDQYKERYPGYPTVSQEYSAKMTERLKRMWENPDFQKSVKDAASIQVRKLNESQRSDPNRRSQMSEQMRKQSKEWWSDPEYRKKQSIKSSRVMTDLNRKNWKDPDYINERKECSSKTMTRTLNRLWKEDEYRERMSIRSQEALRKQGRLSSHLHELISDYLNSIGVAHQNEVRVKGVLVDILLNDGRIIEVNGDYWHGRHDLPLESMTPDQQDGYRRDLKRISILGEDNILFLWESEYYDGSYVSKIEKFIKEGR